MSARFGQLSDETTAGASSFGACRGKFRGVGNVPTTSKDVEAPEASKNTAPYDGGILTVSWTDSSESIRGGPQHEPGSLLAPPGLVLRIVGMPAWSPEGLGTVPRRQRAEARWGG
jgi:hypothetical protein